MDHGEDCSSLSLSLSVLAYLPINDLTVIGFSGALPEPLKYKCNKDHGFSWHISDFT